MITIRQTRGFKKWMDKLKDRAARARIEKRLVAIATRGHFGDSKSVGEGVFELRIDYGPGYRVYYIERGSELVIILAGGTKRRQQADIANARAIAKEL